MGVVGALCASDHRPVVGGLYNMPQEPKERPPEALSTVWGRDLSVSRACGVWLTVLFV